jgi:hypothetical protein
MSEESGRKEDLNRRILSLVLGSLEVSCSCPTCVEARAIAHELISSMKQNPSPKKKLKKKGPEQ